MDTKTIIRQQTAGNAIHMDRGTYTMAIWERKWDDDVEVKFNGKPIPIPRMGRNLKIGDILPERRGVAVNPDGNLLSQGDFEARYGEWLRGFGGKKDLSIEPIPTVVSFVSKVMDPYRSLDTAHVSYVDIGSWIVDPNAKPINEPMWGPDGESIEEWRAKNQQSKNEKMDSIASSVKMLTDLKNSGDISEAAFARKVAALFDEDGDVSVSRPDREPAESVYVSAGETSEGTLVSPCGRTDLKNVGSHVSKCSQPECVAAREQRNARV